MLSRLTLMRLTAFRPRSNMRWACCRCGEVTVCGHTDCGVMRGALNPEALEAYPNVTAWLSYVTRHFTDDAKVGRREQEPSAESLLALTEDNVVAQLENLRSHPTVAARLEQGDLA